MSDPEHLPDDPVPPRPSAETPFEDPAGLRVDEPGRVAAGFSAVVRTARRVLQETGARRGLRLLTRVNQKGPGGFDCPSCAWPDPDGERHVAEFCEQGAKAVTDEATRARVTPGFFREWSVADLSRQPDAWLNRQGRLTHPMVLRKGARHYEPIAWPDAFRMIGTALHALASPDEAVFYTSGRTSNEAAFLLQLFARRFGTNNLPDCSNLCHESSGLALKQVIGVGKGTVTLDDFARADVLFIIGQNPGTNHPRMLTTLEQARRRGATLVSINPLPEAGLLGFRQPQDYKTPAGLLKQVFGPPTRISDLFLPVRINGDVALLKGIAKAILEEEDLRPGAVLDHAFIEAHTTGFEAFAEDVRREDWGVLVEESGIAEAQIREAAGVLIRAERAIFCWAMGLTQHKNAVANIQEIVNVALLRGFVGRPGAGLCPVRGHSNVQGDRTMGITSRPGKALLERLGATFHFTPPQTAGYDTVQSIEAMHAGKVGVFFALGGNFLSASPDTAFTAEALRRCKLTVQVSTKLNRAHLVTGEEALILPCLGRTEADVQAGTPQFVSVENSMGIVHASRGTLPPASAHLMSEPALVAALARATLGDGGTVGWAAMARDYDRIRDGIAAVVPGCADYNRRVREPGGFYLPNAAREGRFETASGKAHFTVHPVPRHALGAGQFMMMTIRSHEQFNTTIYGEDDRYRGIRGGRRVVLLNPDDMKAHGLQQADLIDLVSHFEGEERVAPRFAAVPYPIPRRCAATYFPEANVLVPVRSTADGSNTPASKSVVITLRPAGPGDGAPR